MKSYLIENPVPINNKILSMYRVDNKEIVPKKVINVLNPLDDESEQLLRKLKEMHFNLFEDLMLEFLFKIGYGVSKESIKQNIKKTHDGGLDGHIELDVLGLDKIYIQAKRWNDKSPVRSRHIQRLFWCY